jgi:hypothetical protein
MRKVKNSLIKIKTEKSGKRYAVRQNNKKENKVEQGKTLCNPYFF